MRTYVKTVAISVFCSLLVSAFQPETEAAPPKQKRVIVGQSYTSGYVNTGKPGVSVTPSANRQGSPSKPITAPGVISGKSADPWEIQRWQYQEVQKLMRF